MADTSLNGWPVLKSGSKRLKTGTVPGTKIRLTCHVDALPVLLAVAAAVNEQVCPLAAGNKDGQDEGGWVYREARDSDRWSNHASGSAIDLNWRRWVRLRRDMTKRERAAAARIARRVDEVVQWGGFWERLVDEHHWEIKSGVTPAEVRSWTSKHIGPDGRLK